MLVKGEAYKAGEARAGFLEQGADAGGEGSTSLRKMRGGWNGIPRHLAALPLAMRAFLAWRPGE